MASETIGELRIRPFRLEIDDIEELTTLLHKAYKQLADMGLNYTATYQDSTETRRRIQNGHCLVGEINDRFVATIIYYRPGLMSGCSWYCQEGVGVIGQFGVLPEFQGKGVGSKLLDAVEAMALKDECRELALDTAEPAIHLHRYYERRGYRIVDYVQWEGKTYRSVIMSKRLR
jgi:GNAT superfamily N-acetyltransferase